LDYIDSVNKKKAEQEALKKEEFLHKQSLAVSKQNTKDIVDTLKQDSKTIKKVKIADTGDLASKQDIDAVIKQLKENQLAQLMGNQKSSGKPAVVLANGTDVEDIMAPLASKIDEALKTLANNNKDEKVAKALDKSFKDFARAMSLHMVNTKDATIKSSQDIQDAITSLDLRPVVNVPTPKVTVNPTNEVNLDPLLSKLDAVNKSIANIPTPSLDTTEMTQAVDSVRRSIESLRFPTPNYVLPYADSDGSATQVTLTSQGRIPVELGVSPTIDIGDVQVKNASGTVINPSTEEKQDALISAVDDLTIAQSQTDVFDQLVTSIRYNQVEIDYSTADPDAITDITVTKTSTGDATTANGQAVFSTGTGTTGGIKAVTNTSVTYRPHAETYAAFSAIFTAGVANSYQRVGIYDTNNGFFIGYEGTSFGITVRQSTVDTTVAKASFNVDTLSGQSGSKYTRNGVPEALDPTKDNLYRIRFGWLGASGIFFEVLSPDQEWVTFHIHRVINTAIIPSVANPNLPITLDARKTSGATNIVMNTACWAAGTTSNFQKLTSTLTDSTLATLNRSVITGQTTGGGGGYVNVKVNPSGALAVENTPSTSSTGTVSTASVTNSNTTVLTSNGNRKGATIYNEGTVTALVKLGSTASATSYTVKIITDAYYEVPFGFTGIVTGITASGTATLRVTELT
jgi:hypothetical protein